MRAMQRVCWVLAVSLAALASTACQDDHLPVILVHPADRSAVAPEMVTFSVEVTGATSVTWQARDASTAFANIPGATGDRFTIAATELAMNGRQFRAVAVNATGVVFSNGATLTVTEVAVAPAIVTQPADASVALGAAATFEVVATGSAPLTYQWQHLDEGAWVALAGATSAALTTAPTVALDDGRQFRVEVRNALGSVVSEPAALAVVVPTQAPAIVTHPADVTVSSGATATFAVVATGTPAPTYEWERDDGAGGWTTLGPGAAQLTTAPTSLANSGTRYRVRVRNSEGVATSDPATLTVTPSPLVDFAQVVTGNRHTVGLKTDGTVWAWGNNHRGQIGRPGGDSRIPAQVDGLSGTFVAVYARGNTSFAIRSDGTLWSWGDNAWGVLGNDGVAVGDRSSTAVPVLRASDGEPLTDVAGVAVNDNGLATTALAWTTTGTAWSWASTYLDPGVLVAFSSSTPPRQRAIPDPWFDASTPERTLARAVMGQLHALAIVGDGAAVSWDRVDLGDTTTVSASDGVPVLEIAAAYAISFVIRDDYTLWVRGTGHTGLGAITSAPGFTQIPLGFDVDRVAVADHQNTVQIRRTDGQLYAWGANDAGQLGDGTIGGVRNTAAPVLIAPDVVQLVPGHGVGLALRPGGAVWGCGSNEYGGLGSTGNLTGTPYALTGP